MLGLRFEIEGCCVGIVIGGSLGYEEGWNWDPDTWRRDGYHCQQGSVENFGRISKTLDILTHDDSCLPIRHPRLGLPPHPRSNFDVGSKANGGGNSYGDVCREIRYAPLIGQIP